MRKVDYDTMYDKNTGGTATHMATDAAMQRSGTELQNAYEEGFASASGVRNATAESGGRIKHPEAGDSAHPHQRPAPDDNENAGLADN